MPQDEDSCEPSLALLPQQKQRGKKRQWVSDTFQSLMESVGGGGEGGFEDEDTSVRAAIKADQGGRETAQELERLLGEVSSFEGRLDNLLDLSSSIPDRNNGVGEQSYVHSVIAKTKIRWLFIEGVEGTSVAALVDAFR